MAENENPLALMKQIEATEGWKIMARIHTHSISYHVFNGNYEELSRALKAYHDPEFGLTLWEVKNTAKLDLFQKEIIRLVHNYVASAKSLVEHTRNFVREHYSNSKFEKEYLSKVNETFHDPFSEFVIKLRDFTLHNGLPTIFSDLHLERGRPVEFRILLDVISLRKWKRWSRKSKEYLKTLRPQVELDLVVEEYKSKVAEFYEWFGKEVQELHSKEFAQTNLLQQKLRDLSSGDMIS